MSLRARKKVQLRQAVLSACRRLFRDPGFDATTVEDIADAAGISRQTFFNHFSSKDAVLLDLGAEWLRSQAEAPAAGLRSVASATPGSRSEILDGMRRAIAAQAAAMEADQGFIKLVVTRSEMFSARPADSGRSSARRDQVRSLISAVAALIEKAQAGGEVRPDADPDRIAEVLVSGLFMTVRLWANGYWEPEEPLAPRLLATLDLLEQGFVARSL